MKKNFQNILQKYNDYQNYKKISQIFYLSKKILDKFEDKPKITIRKLNFLYNKIKNNNFNITEKEVIFQTYIKWNEHNDLAFDKFEAIIKIFFNQTILKIISLKFSLNIFNDYYLNLETQNGFCNVFSSKETVEMFSLEQLINKQWNYNNQAINIIKSFFKTLNEIIYLLSINFNIINFKIYDWIFYFNNKELLTITHPKILAYINKHVDFKKLSYVSWNYQEIINKISK